MPIPRREYDSDPYVYAFERDLPRSLGESISATTADPRLRPTEMAVERAALTPGQAEAAAEQSAALGIPPLAVVPGPEAKPKTPLMEPEEVRAEFGSLGVNFEIATPRDVVEATARRRQDDMHRNEIIEASPQGLGAKALRLGASFAGSIYDPINIASAFVPGGEFLMGVKAADFTVGKRVAAGAISGFTGNVAVEPLNYGLSRQQQLDYSMVDSLVNLTVGTGLGAGIGGISAGFAKFGGDVEISPEAREAALRSAVATFETGDTVEAGAILELDRSIRERQAAKVGPQNAGQVAGDIESLVGMWRLFQGRRGRPPKEDILQGARQTLAQAGITPDMTEAQVRLMAEDYYGRVRQQNVPLTPEEKASVIADNREAVNRMAERKSEWDQPLEEATTPENYDLDTAVQMDEDAFALIEREIVSGRDVEGDTPSTVQEALQAGTQKETPARGAAGSEGSGDAGMDVGGSNEPAPDYAPQVDSAIPSVEVGVDGEAGVFTFDASTLGVDAQRFQFKSGGDAEGVTARLKSVKAFSRVLAGQVMVWEDKAGGLWVVDGHQRVGLAKRIKAETPDADTQVTGILLREADGWTAEEAMVAAAKKNIAEGSGSAIDAAKIGRVYDAVFDEALPLTGGETRMASELMSLGDEPFQMVVNEVVLPNYGAVVGRLLPDDNMRQKAAVDLIAKTFGNDTIPSHLAEVESLVRQVRDEALYVDTQTSLFGEEVVASSLAVEKAKVAAAAGRLIRQDKKVFSTLMKEAGRIEEAGNVLSAENNAQRAQIAGELMQQIEVLAYKKGAISDALTEAAQRVKEGLPVKTAARGFIEAVHGKSAFGSAKGRGPGAAGGAGDAADAGLVFEGPDGQPIPGDATDGVTPKDLVAQLSGKDGAPREASMEDIIASIKKLIEEDEVSTPKSPEKGSLEDFRNQPGITEAALVLHKSSGMKLLDLEAKLASFAMEALNAGELDKLEGRIATSLGTAPNGMTFEAAKILVKTAQDYKASVYPPIPKPPPIPLLPEVPANALIKKVNDWVWNTEPSVLGGPVYYLVNLEGRYVTRGWLGPIIKGMTTATTLSQITTDLIKAGFSPGHAPNIAQKIARSAGVPLHDTPSAPPAPPKAPPSVQQLSDNTTFNPAKAFLDFVEQFDADVKDIRKWTASQGGGKPNIFITQWENPPSHIPADPGNFIVGTYFDTTGSTIVHIGTNVKSFEEAVALANEWVGNKVDAPAKTALPSGELPAEAGWQKAYEGYGGATAAYKMGDAWVYGQPDKYSGTYWYYGVGKVPIQDDIHSAAPGVLTTKAAGSEGFKEAVQALNALIDEKGLTAEHAWTKNISPPGQPKPKPKYPPLDSDVRAMQDRVNKLFRQDEEKRKAFETALGVETPRPIIDLPLFKSSDKAADLAAARQKRREEMGYTQVAFRGGGVRGSTYPAQSPRIRSGNQVPGGVFFSDKPKIASAYATDTGSVVYPVYLRTKGFWDVDWSEKFGQTAYDTTKMDKLIKEAREAGYPGVIARNMSDIGESGPQTQYIVFDSSAIRGWFARFDPEERHSGDIMAKLGGPQGAPVKPVNAEIARAAVDIMQRLPEGIQTRVLDKLEFAGEELAGGFSPSEGIVYLTARTLDPVGTLRHEELHVLRQLGLLDEREWGVLTARADKLREELGVDSEYRGWLERQGWEGDQLEDVLREEAVAKMVEDYQSGTRFGSKIDKVLQAIVDFLDRLRNAAKGLGFQNYDDVMRRIESGEVGRRPQPLTPDMEAQGGMSGQRRIADADKQALMDAVERKASVDELQELPIIKRYIRSAEAIPSRSEEKGYGSLDWKQKAEYIVDGQRLVGFDNAVKNRVEFAKSYAKGKVRNEKQATVLIGPPAAGKSGIAEQIAPLRGAAIADPDDAKKIIPGFTDGIGSSAVHVESGHINGSVLADLADEGANLVIPKVGAYEQSITGLTQRLQAKGYRVEVVLVDVADDEAFRRSIARFVETGRLITPKYMVEDVDGNPRRLYEKLKEKGLADDFAKIDNNGPAEGEKAIEGTALSDLPGLRESGGRRLLPGMGRAGPEPIGQEVTSELTAFGEQLVLPGAEKISQAEMNQRQADKPLRSEAQQEPPGPLFDDYQMDLIEQMRLARADETVQKAEDMGPSIEQAARCLFRKGLL